MPFIVGKELRAGARLTISAPQGGGESNPGMTISVSDDASLTEALEIQISHEDLMRALTGHGYIRCQATWRVSKLGLKREHKEEKGVTEENLHTFEVDGWKGRKKTSRTSIAEPTTRRAGSTPLALASSAGFRSRTRMYEPRFFPRLGDVKLIQEGKRVDSDS